MIILVELIVSLEEGCEKAEKQIKVPSLADVTNGTTHEYYQWKLAVEDSRSSLL